mgnify:CR=1 FL=1
MWVISPSSGKPYRRCRPFADGAVSPRGPLRRVGKNPHLASGPCTAQNARWHRPKNLQPGSHRPAVSIPKASRAGHTSFNQVKRGKLRPEARIDLHGMTLQQAHPELIGFILKSHANGCRLVLVITGKGKPGQGEDIIPRRSGVLRHKVPQWLRLAPVSSAILEVTPAHVKHGGGGAFYVYLRRHR